MNDGWQDSTDKPPGIVKAEGTPKASDESHLNRRELFSNFCNFMGRTLAENGELAQNYARAKGAQETNTAQKIGEEAAEIASRREENEAKADLIHQQSDGEFIENLMPAFGRQVDVRHIRSTEKKSGGQCSI